jgi:hypothetical protein
VRIKRSHVLRLELAEQFVAARDHGVERLLRRLGAAKQGLEFLVDDVADLDVVAEPETLRILGRRVQRDLLDTDVGARVLLVIALLLAGTKTPQEALDAVVSRGNELIREFQSQNS